MPHIPEFRQPGSGGSICSHLLCRTAICRCVRDLADVAGAERADRHPDGYTVAGVAGALVSTLAMCVPTACVPYWVSSRLLTDLAPPKLPAINSGALVPDFYRIGCASSGLILGGRGLGDIAGGVGRTGGGGRWGGGVGGGLFSPIACHRCVTVLALRRGLIN